MPAKPGPTPETKAVCWGWGAPCGGGRRPTSTTNVMDRWTQGPGGMGTERLSREGAAHLPGPRERVKRFKV